ncbi:hypothetical protein ABW20_dc0100939 [Dactylellina cionopaga]|nr:hypothetical protein ABW20_dc0100939 [Dactylellina cionopaga]
MLFSNLTAAFCVLLAFADAAAVPKAENVVVDIEKRQGGGGHGGGGGGGWSEVSLTRWNYVNNQLTGTVKVRDVPGRGQKQVQVWYASGGGWNRQSIAGQYYGPAERGYEWWTFNGWALRADQFYITYNVRDHNSDQTFYDPSRGKYYWIGKQGPPNGPPNGPPHKGKETN